MKNVAFSLLCFTLLVLVAAPAWADQCSGALPLNNLNTPVPYAPSSATGCGALITVATVDPETGAATSFIVTIPNNGNGNPYDGLEDTLVGIQNNSGASLTSITLSSSGSPLFAFDGDGVCESSPNGADCFFPEGYTPTGYEGPNNTFSNYSTLTSGTVNFTTAILNGWSTWFALEGTPQSVTTVSQTKTLGPPGTTTTFTFNTDSYKVTGVNNSGGEVLTVEAVLVPASQFPILVNFPNETCVPYGDYSGALGQDTCVEFHVECTGQLDCTTGFSYLVATGYDLPTSLSGGIGGPDFLVRHGGSCPLLSADNVQSIFLSYTADVKDPTTKGGSGTPSCFVATYTPGASLITSGTTSRFVGFESPVIDTELNLVQAGATRPLKWQWFDIAGNPVTNLTWCASPNPAPGSCTAPWVNLQYYGISCATDAPLNTGTTDVSGPGSSGLQNLGGGRYQFNWKTVKGWANTCSTVQITFDSGLVLVPAVGFKFK